jgi:hypothetical protein
VVPLGCVTCSACWAMLPHNRQRQSAGNSRLHEPVRCWASCCDLAEWSGAKIAAVCRAVPMHQRHPAETLPAGARRTHASCQQCVGSLAHAQKHGAGL